MDGKALAVERRNVEGSLRERRDEGVIRRGWKKLLTEGN
jgi:hypothetical protein